MFFSIAFFIINIFIDNIFYKYKVAIDPQY